MFAIKYQLYNQLAARCGFTTGSSAFYVSAGYRLRYFQLDVVGSVHPQLGFTPGLLLTFNRSEK